MVIEVVLVVVVAVAKNLFLEDKFDEGDIEIVSDILVPLLLGNEVV